MASSTGALQAMGTEKHLIVSSSALRCCFVPLSEMFGYATNLRSRTQGRGQFTMEPSHYVELSKNLADAVISKRKGY